MLDCSFKVLQIKPNNSFSACWGKNYFFFLDNKKNSTNVYFFVIIARLCPLTRYHKKM